MGQAMYKMNKTLDPSWFNDLRHEYYVILSYEGNLLWTAPGWSSLFGKDPCSIENIDFATFLAPADVERFQTFINTVKSSTQPENDTFQFQGVNETLLTFSITAQSRENDKVICMTAFEISESKKTKDNLAYALNILKFEEELASIGHWELDCETSKLTWSDQMYKIYQVDPIYFEPTLEVLASFLHPDDHERIIAETHNVAIAKNDTIDMLYRIIRPDGDIRMCRSRSKTIKGANGKASMVHGITQDITEIANMETNLAATLDRLDVALSASDSAVIDFDLNTDSIYLSPHMYDLLGLSEKHDVQEVQDVNWVIKFVHPDDVRKLIVLRDGTFKPGETFSVEVRIKPKNGEHFWVNLAGRCSVDDLGKAKRFIAAVLKIDHYKKLLEELTAINQRYDLATEATGIGLWETGQDGRIFCSPRMREILGETDPDWCPTPKDFISRIHPLDNDRALQAYHKLHEENQAYKIEYRLRRNDGSYVWVHSRARLVLNSKGEKDRTVGVMEDISEAKEAQLALQKSEARFESIAKAAGEFIFELDRSGALTYVSDRLLDVTGYKPEDLLGGGLSKLSPPRKKSELPALGEKLAKEQIELKNFEFEIINASSESKWLNMSAIRTYDENDEWVGYCGSASDITERKLRENELKATREELQLKLDELQDTTERLELQAAQQIEMAEQLAEARDKADAANRAKSEFLATMSHEIRTPMNGVLGMADLLLATDLSRDAREKTQVIKESGESLLDLLNDILDLSKVEAGALELEIIDFDLEELLYSANRIWTHRFEERGIDFSIEYDPGTIMGLQGDPTRIRQILYNLISNALKFTEQGHVQVHIKQTLLDKQMMETRIEIHDTGIGISQDAQERLFDKFTQADASTTRKYGGTGLGLAICRHLTHLMNGEIGVTSEQGQGSIFWFTIRCEKSEYSTTYEQYNEPTTHVDTAEAKSFDDLRILVAEDNRVNQKVILSILTAAGVMPEFVDTGTLALEAAKSKDFDIILMDIQMPGMDGVTAMKHIRALGGRNEHIPVIALTANAMMGDREKYISEGMTDYISKPISPANLIECINRVCGTVMDAPQDEDESAA